MAKQVKEKKPSKAVLKKKRVKELFGIIRSKLSGIKCGYIVNEELKELEDLVK